MSKIPEEIKQAFADLAKLLDGEIAFLGSKDGVDYYIFRPFEDLDIGFPSVCGYDDGNVVSITGTEALDVIELFIKD